MPTIPSPPPDDSGGYMIVSYTNGLDTHRSRIHVRALNSDATFSAPSAVGNPSVMAEFTALWAKLMKYYNNAWSATLQAIFKNNGDGTFTELFGWTGPAPVAGSGPNATPSDQERAVQLTRVMHDGFGGRLKIVQIGIGAENATNIPAVVGGVAGGTAEQDIVDYLSTASKTNVVARTGHVAQSPARLVYCVNRRLRRHYKYD